MTEDVAAEALGRARHLLALPDPVAAIAPLEAAAAATGLTQVEALRALVRLRTGLGQDAVAAAHGRTLLALRPEDDQARFLLGRSLHLLGWPDLALRCFRALRAPVPAWWVAMTHDVAAELSAARLEALAACRAWRRGRRDAQKLARLLLRAGHPRAAEAVLAARPVDQRGDWAEALVRLRLAEGAPDAELRATLRHPPALNWRDALAAARMLLQIGEVAAAEAMLATLPDHLSSPAGALLRTRLLLLAGEVPRLRAVTAAAFAAKPYRSDPARQAVTALVLDRAIPIWRGPDPAAGSPLTVPLVQYWDTPDPPSDVLEVMESWVRHHPGLPLARFHAASARDFLAGVGAEALAAFESCRHPAMQSDVLRMVFLARHGGLWADVDERCLRPVSEWLARLPRLGLLAAFSDEIPYYVHSYVLAAPPGSGVMARLVARMLPPLVAAARRGQQVRIWEATGPGLVTRAVAAEADPSAVALLEPGYFRGFVGAVEDLGYRRTAAGNWRLA
ncbi:glycosyltransferase [Falsiroseomonas sp. E2-1-a20]|uniref:glycosyltransferase family 32 protein n=1 Tax=Falsiroseomonas sp. E2-1-a20 TaxID=3239300 RepID=UPI003F31BBD4